MANIPVSGEARSEAPLLVLGRRGQLASDLVEAGARLGTALIALGRPDLELTEPETIARALDRHRPAAVINAAAYTAVDKAESEPDLAFAVNRDGPAHLARLCARAGLPLIHLSTDQVFDGRKAGGHREGDPAHPLCVYGRSKLEGEQAVAEAHPEAVIARVSWVFGPSGSNFVTRLLEWAATRDSVAIVSDQRGRPTYSPALAEALIGLARDRLSGSRERPSRRSRPGEGIIHLAGASVMTRYEQALAVVKAARARGAPALRIEPVLTRDFPTPAKRPLNAELDVSLAAARYGIRFRPFEEDLEATLDRLIGPRR
jgi:dTDP-4-dehydrorhamnose reductase